MKYIQNIYETISVLVDKRSLTGDSRDRAQTVGGKKQYALPKIHKKSWLYVTEELIHKHLYKDINYCISISHNTHTPTHTQAKLKAERRGCKTGRGNQGNNLAGGESVAGRTKCRRAD